MVKSLMPSIKLSLTVEQVKALFQIGQIQLFHMKFLNPKLPGYKAQPGELQAAESAVRVLEAALKEEKLQAPPAWQNPSRRVPPMPRVK